MPQRTVECSYTYKGDCISYYYLGVASCRKTHAGNICGSGDHHLGRFSNSDDCERALNEYKSSSGWNCPSNTCVDNSWCISQCGKYEEETGWNSARVTAPDVIEGGKTYNVTTNSGILRLSNPTGCTLSGTSFTVISGITKVSFNIRVVWSECGANGSFSWDLKKNQVITFKGPIDFVVGVLNNLEIESTSGLSNFVLSSDSEGVVIAGTSVLITKVGIHNVTIVEPGNSEYNSASLQIALICGIDCLSPVLVSGV